MNSRTGRLPRQIEADPRAPRLLEILEERARPLRADSDVMVPFVELTGDLASALRSANMSGRAARGLERAEELLDQEEHGLKLAEAKHGVSRGQRISRLLVMTSDGSDRFYRRVETLLRRHAPRLLAIRLDADSERLGVIVFGPGRVAKLLMMEHKDAVSAVLMAMAGLDEGS